MDRYEAVPHNHPHVHIEGEYVKYDDAQAEIAELQEKLRHLAVYEHIDMDNHDAQVIDTMLKEMDFYDFPLTEGKIMEYANNLRKK
jgi:hypothetical protein